MKNMEGYECASDHKLVLGVIEEDVIYSNDAMPVVLMIFVFNFDHSHECLYSLPLCSVI